MTEDEFLALPAEKKDAMVAARVMGHASCYVGDCYTLWMGAASFVLAKMEESGWGWTADRRSDRNDPFTYAWRFHKGKQIHRADISTLPLAICIAALKAVGAIQ